MARLDRLGSAKEVAQIGAAIGREFSHALLAAVARKPEAELASALDRLVEAGLLFRQGVPPHATYLFKHALVQDAAYGTLLRAKRQELHARIADVLEEKFPETTATQPEILARHCGEAGLTRRAIAYWQRAGERAAHRSANVEAIAHFKRGLDLIEASPDAAGHAEEELALLIALGPVLMATRSSAAPEVSRLYSRARVLAQQLGRSAKLYTAFWGAGRVPLGRRRGRRNPFRRRSLRDRARSERSGPGASGPSRRLVNRHGRRRPDRDASAYRSRPGDLRA